ncbi:MAG: fructose-6-phosphate aldolase [Dehalococcoidales bacterium]|nr:MAG: fructose-6-phosphate aldolase [Dehalococcoidales bacterium]
MQIFIDSASVGEIVKWLEMGVIDGVTTNPTIMFEDGVYDIEAGVRTISALVDPLPTCVEVTTDEPDDMVVQARLFASWAPNVVIKVPHITTDGVPCYGIIRELETEGIKVNATAAMSLGQVILAAKAGATYISLFAGRVSDEGGNAPEVIRMAVEWLGRWRFKSKVIVGSIRSVGDVLNAVMAGAHIVTIPPPFLNKMADHKYSRETVKQFLSDAEKALRLMQQAMRTG